MLEYKIDDQITLKLIKNKTVIYIDGEEFNQCKLVEYAIQLSRLSSRDIESMDAFFDSFQSSNNQSVLSPKDEFWVHCSNLQAWVENNYSTSLLDSRLSFPILKELSENNPRANIIFKEEIAKRFKQGSYSVLQFLMNEDYLSYLSEEELITGALSLEDSVVMTQIIEKTEIDYQLVLAFDEEKVRLKDNNDVLYFSISKGYINAIEMELNKENIELLSLIEGLKELRVLYVYINNVESLDIYVEIPALAVLKVYIKNTSMIRRIGGLHKLRDLTIIGLDNTTRPLLTNFDLHSMPNLKKIQLLNLLVANFPWDSNLLIDIDCEINRPVD